MFEFFLILSAISYYFLKRLDSVLEKLFFFCETVKLLNGICTFQAS